ncbi:MAG: Response regulator PleD [Synergistetes bacterium ADurb.Bin155]|jgi:diguanylate cyclase (GGDEF)-like protein|nr:diguanylate cyclase [Synergistales bacterium]MBP8995256.1 diguanylate cyclase [Synergistales bacterium]NMD18497.1 diguanylate cyclase [Synergistaceae bacterium]OQB46202.1 MAG: Response regulator PleD [Synergistetes bacterium ADurb.Bin155]HQL02220.1 diguanylate cyclase [Synergistales bacterium]
MAVKLIIFISLVLQLAAAIVACRLLPVSRRHPGLYLFIAAVALILGRRFISFFHALSGADPAGYPLVFESTALAVSLLLLLAAVWSVPLIRQYITDSNELFQKHSNICQVIHDLAVPAFVLGKDHTVTHWNKACENLTGIAAGDMVGSKDAWKAFYHEARPLLADLILDEVAPEEYARHYSDAPRPSITLEGGWEVEAFLPALGEGRWISFAASPLRNLEGAICGAIETFQDTTPQKTAGLVLSRSASGLRTLHEITREISGEKTLPDLLDLTVRLLREKMHISNVTILENAAEKREKDVRLRLKASSGLDAAAMERLTENLQRSGRGLSTRAALSRKVLVTADVSKSPDYVPFFEGSISEIDVPILDGERVLGVVTVEGYAPFDSQDEEFLTILSGHLASLWKSLELVAEVESLALTDQLTGLPNRRALFQRLDSEEKRLNRYGGKMSIVMMDMTGFKEVNDTYGHLMGDATLQAASLCVRDSLRESDFVARFGGDEFVVLMPETGAEEAAAATKRISEKLVEVRVSGIPLKLTAHFGLSRYPEDGKKLAAVLKKADDRMCEEKTPPGNN